MKTDAEPNQTVLRRLADTLGISVERFFADAPALDSVANEDECLRLWSRIETEAGRRQALEALRMISDHEGAQSEP
jgi:hypothetical protein